MVEINLTSDTFSLILKIVDVVYFSGLAYDWCHLYLKFAEKEIFLGAEEKSILVKKILNGIALSPGIVNDRRKGLIEGNNYYYFLGLSEGEHLIGYVRELTSGRELVLKNGISGNPIAIVRISDLECQAWQQQLRAIFCETPLSQNLNLGS